jgi:hypothetical protein
LQYGQALSSWPLLRYWGMSGTTRFGDLKLTLAQIDCELGRNQCNTTQITSEYVYGKFLIQVMRLFPSLIDSSEFIGWFFIFAITLAICISVVKYEPKSYLIATYLILLSPPYQLLIERMNIDLVIFLAILISSLLYSRGIYRSSLVVVTISALIKFYPLSLLALYLRPSSRRNFLINAFFVLSLSIYVLFEFSNVTNRISPITGGNFGLPVLLSWISKIPYPLLSGLGIWIVGLLLVIYLIISSNYFRKSDEVLYLEFPNEKSIFSFFTFLLIPIYICTFNWDYRLIFFNVPFLMIFLLYEKFQGIYRFHIWCLFVTVNYLSYNVAAPLQLIGDISVLFSLVAFCLLNLKYLNAGIRQIYST